MWRINKMSLLRQKANQMIKESLEAVMPDRAVEKALENFQGSGGRTDRKSVV